MRNLGFSSASIYDLISVPSDTDDIERLLTASSSFDLGGWCKENENSILFLALKKALLPEYATNSRILTFANLLLEEEKGRIFETAWEDSEDEERSLRAAYC